MLPSQEKVQLQLSRPKVYSLRGFGSTLHGSKAEGRVIYDLIGTNTCTGIPITCGALEICNHLPLSHTRAGVVKSGRDQ